MKITIDMVNEFNQTLEEIGCVFCLKYDGTISNPQCKISPKTRKFINSCIINPNKEFYQLLKEFFLNNGIELSCNNNGTVFWSKRGFTK